MTIEKELAELTNNFTEKETAVKCWSVSEKEKARNIFKKYYDIVEVSDGRRSDKDKMCWIIACANPKQLQEALNEADEEELDLSEFDDLDPNDDMDMDEYDLDSIDDSSEVDDANQLTILKKRAADLADKWQDTFKQISDLARKLDLTVSHDNNLNIEIKKSNGQQAKVEKDLDDIKSELGSEEEEIDDSFGPSEYDNRAKMLGPDEEIKEESLQPELPAAYINEEYPWKKDSGTLDLGYSEDPNELYLDPNRVDDDM